MAVIRLEDGMASCPICHIEGTVVSNHFVCTVIRFRMINVLEITFQIIREKYINILQSFVSIHLRYHTDAERLSAFERQVRETSFHKKNIFTIKLRGNFTQNRKMVPWEF